MIIHLLWKRMAYVALLIFTVRQLLPQEAVSAQEAEFPQNNVWTRVTPSVVWCGDTSQKVTIEVHIVGRHDVAKVWVTSLVTANEQPLTELFDDGTHGDLTSGDNVFTIGNIVLPCNPDWIYAGGFQNWLGFLQVQLGNGDIQENRYGIEAGLVDPKYKGSFPVHDFGNGLSATAYAFFIVDDKHEVMNDYPLAAVHCGTSNYQAYQKFYSVFPDDFDIALVTPGMEIVHPGDLGENVPYNVLVSNAVQHIGLRIMNNSARFGSAGRLKSTVYESFGDIQIFDHEIAHTWGASLGRSLGLLDDDNEQDHWNRFADMQGQLGAFYFDAGGADGHFAYNGDGTWHLISNSENEPYSPLELYMMGMIPPDQVPPIHILSSPNTSDKDHITAASYRTVTIQDIMNTMGGARIPSSADSQKDFNVAYIVTQDIPYNDSAYAFFSLHSYNLMSKDPPRGYNMLAPFYWATGGRGTLNTHLPVDVPDSVGLPGMSTLTPTISPTWIPTSTFTATSIRVATQTPLPSETILPGTPTKTASKGTGCATAPIALVIVTIGLSQRKQYSKPG